MIKFALSLITIYLLILIQSSLYPYLEFYDAFPNFILIIIVILSVLRGFKKSLIWIIFGGFFLDIYSFNNPIGVSILGLALVSYSAYFFSQNLFKKSSIFSVILIGVFETLIYKFFLISASLIVNIGLQLSFNQMVSQVIYNLVILIPLFYLIKKREF